MTVAELRAILAECPDDHLVVLAKDSEGNRFGLCGEAVSGAYEPYNEWSGHFWNAESAPRRVPLNAVCLWPVN